MDRAELSIEISRIVSRALNGETIDVAVEGEGLAVKYPGLGMSGQMIADAIASATGMMGMIRSGNGAAAPAETGADEPQALVRTDATIAGAPTAGGTDFEAPADGDSEDGGAAGGTTPDAAGGTTPGADEAGSGLGAIFSRGAVAFRRALFRA